MKTTSTLAAVTGLISAASAQYFGLTAARSASPIHYQTLTASGQSIWLNKPTSAYCPENIEALGACPSGDFTTFAGGENTLGMGVVVPGGQEVYIEPTTGEVKYTIAHSVSKPEGSIVTGWSTGMPFISVSLCVRVSSPPARNVCSVSPVASVSIASRAALDAT